MAFFNELQLLKKLYQMLAEKSSDIFLQHYTNDSVPKISYLIQSHIVEQIGRRKYLLRSVTASVKKEYLLNGLTAHSNWKLAGSTSL